MSWFYLVATHYTVQYVSRTFQHCGMSRLMPMMFDLLLIVPVPLPLRIRSQTNVQPKRCVWIIVITNTALVINALRAFCLQRQQICQLLLQFEQICLRLQPQAIQSAHRARPKQIKSALLKAVAFFLRSAPTPIAFPLQTFVIDVYVSDQFDEIHMTIYPAVHMSWCVGKNSRCTSWKFLRRAALSQLAVPWLCRT